MSSYQERLQAQKAKAAIDIQAYVDKAYHRVTTTELEYEFGYSRTRIGGIVKLFTDLSLAEYAERKRDELFLNYITSSEGTFDGLLKLSKYDCLRSLNSHLMKRFRLSFSHIRHLHSIGRLEKYLESEHRKFGEFISEEMVEYIDGKGGWVAITTEMQEEFGYQSNALFHMWNKYNGPDTILDYCRYVRLRNTREEFLKDPKTVLQFFDETDCKWNRDQLERQHELVYGIRFTTWVNKKIKDLPRYQYKGLYRVAGPDVLETIRKCMLAGFTRDHEVSNITGYSMHSIRSIVTYYEGCSLTKWGERLLKEEQAKTKSLLRESMYSH